MSDLRFALRQFAKAPGFTAVAVLSLALGIGATTTVLCWMQHLVLRPIPGVAAPEQLAVLVSNQGSGPVSLPDLTDITADRRVFAGALASMPTPASLTIDNSPQWITAQVISAGGFDLLGVRPIFGRTFRHDEDQKPGGDTVLVISERLWRGQFAADPQIIGRPVELNHQTFTIVGVVPASFLGTMAPQVTDAWAPLSMIAEVRNQSRGFLDRRSARGWHNIVRLQPGVSPASAQAAVATMQARLAVTYPDTNRDVRYRLLPLSQCPWGAPTVVGPAMRLLLVVCAGVLLIVAANVANLLLARATSRRREIAIRLATGASRSRLVRQLLTESLLLAAAGGALGTLFAVWTVDSLPLLLKTAERSVSLNFSLDGRTLALTLAVTLGTGLVFGLLPALQASRFDLNEALKESGRTGAGGPMHQRMRRGLVVSEIALAMALLVGAALCVKGMSRARAIDVGLDPKNVLIASMRIGMNGYTEKTAPVFYRTLRERLASLPGVEEASLASWLPLGLSGCKGTGVRIDGYVRPEGENPTYEFAIVSPSYFETLRIPLLAGRDFTDADDTQAPGVAIVNQAFAQRFWPGQDPLGRKFRTFGRDITIVGVARTGRYNRLNEDAWPFFYVPYLQGVPDLDLGVVLRTAGEPLVAAEALRQTVRDLDPAVGLLEVMPMTSYVEGSFFAHRMASQILVLLGAVALVLAAMGVYAVMAYTVTQRTQEFGLRMALGATVSAVLWHVLRQGLTLAAAGCFAGLLLAIAATRLLTNFLYGVSPLDPATLIGIPALLGLVAALACWVPALRATTVNPITALRAE